MRLKNIFVGAAASAVMAATFVAAPALANPAPDNYAFGYSGYDGGEYLTLNGATSILTNGVQGWVSPTYANTGGPDGNTNYIAGTCCFGSGDVFANYFVFSLDGVSGPITSASLTISPFSITTDFTYVLHNATPFVGLLYDSGSPDAALYADLGTGTIFGSFGITTGQSYGAPLVFNLNPVALASLNDYIAAGKTQFVISGTVLGQAGSTGGVPEPAAWALMLIGFGGLGAVMRRRREHVALA
jgi:hypothetical protein